MADKVLVESDPSQFLLEPVDKTLPNPLAGSSTPSPTDPDHRPTSGFTPDGIPDSVDTKAPSGAFGVLARDTAINPDLLIANSGGTGGGTTTSAGINGSHAELPFELDPARTPVLGSYNADEQTPSTLTSGWYRLPADWRDRPLLSLSAAGLFAPSNLKLQYTDQELTPGIKDNSIVPTGSIGLIDPGPRPSWRNVRIDTASLPKDLTAVRIVATDYDLAADHFIVVTPPRLPQMQTLQEVVGSEAPTHVDWTSGLFVPCQRPFNFHAGVAEIPEWRIRPGADLAAVSAWQSALGGGPLGWLEVSQRANTVATYLSDDIGRDWGALERYSSYDDAVPATIDYSEVVRSGLWSPAPIRY